MHERKNTKKMKGFLMTEAILSLFVLSAGLTTVLALITSSLKDSFDSRDTIIAVELAQEGVELVRNVRDTAFLATPTTPFVTFDLAKKHCQMSYNDTLFTCTSGLAGDYPLKYSSGFYQHNSGTSTKFSRYLYVYYDGSEATVKSFVYWGSGATGTFKVGDTASSGSTTSCTVAKKCVFTEIILTNWRG